MPLSEIVGMAGRGHTPPDADSSGVESPSVARRRVGLGRMPAASDCRCGARNEPADSTRACSDPRSRKTRRKVSVNQASTPGGGQPRRVPAHPTRRGFPFGLSAFDRRAEVLTL